ncbi:ribonuclease Z [Clostridium sp. DL1XJH146]
MVRVGLLGEGGMMPLPDRFLSAALINFYGSSILIDCGEGTQIQLKKMKWGIKNIDVICLTHYHADHVAGLPGLLSTISNSGRTEELLIIGPQGIKEVVAGLTVIVPELAFELKLVECGKTGLNNFRYKGYSINSILLNHGIECYGYSIEINRKRKFSAKKAEKNNVPKKFWSKLQKGEIIADGKRLYIPDDVLGQNRKGIKISYCTDTRPTDEMVEFVKDSDLFIGEGMYGDDAFLDKAIANKHMLFSECAELANKACVKELWLTHFSPSMVEPEEFLHNALDKFKNTCIGYALIQKEINFSNLDKL